MDSPYLLLALVFIATAVLVEGIAILIQDVRRSRQGNAINRRLRMLSSGESGEAVLRKMTRNGLDSMPPWLVKVPGIPAFNRLLNQAGIARSTPRVLVMLAVAAATGLLLALNILRLSPLVSVLLGLAPVLMFLGVVRIKANRRKAKFEAQLVEAIDMIVRSLRAGHPVASAIGLVSREMPDPLGSEFGLVFDEMTYGLDLRDALDNLANRVANSELHYMVVAVRIQFGTGGNLAEVLASLAKVLRDRSQMQAKIRAWSSEGRLSARILSGLPFVVAGFIQLVNPDYYTTVENDPLFTPLIATGFTGVVLGILFLRRMVNFKY